LQFGLQTLGGDPKSRPRLGDDNFVALNDNLKLSYTRHEGYSFLLSLEVTASLAEQAVDISGVQPKVAVMSLTLNRPESNEHDQQYAHQTHGFVAPLSKAQFNRMQMHPEMPRAVIVDPTRALNEAAASTRSNAPMIGRISKSC
jgi:hypothetical protein